MIIRDNKGATPCYVFGVVSINEAEGVHVAAQLMDFVKAEEMWPIQDEDRQRHIRDMVVLPRTKCRVRLLSPCILQVFVHEDGLDREVLRHGVIWERPEESVEAAAKFLRDTENPQAGDLQPEVRIDTLAEVAHV